MKLTIIDISFWQTPLQIDYDLLANHIDGAIIRAAYGTGEDTKFDQHYLELSARGVPVGAYHYLIGSQSMSKQASAFNQITAGKDLKLGRWMDVEDTRLLTKLNRAKVLEYAALMPDMGIYTSRSKWQAIMGAGSYLTDRKMWVAHYKVGGEPALPQGWNSYTFWQWSSTGRLAGYSGNLDLNDFGGSEDEWNAWVGDGEPEPPVDPPTDPEPDPPTQPKAYKATVTANVLNVRKAPQDIVVGSLKRGAEVEVLDEQDAWRKLGHQLWVSGEWLKRIANAPDPQPQPDLVPYVLWGQRDARWASDRMGASNITLGQQGCLVTAVASVMASYGIDTDPKRYNGRLSSEGGYLAPNLMYWQMPRIFWGVKLTEYELFAGGTGWQRSVDTILSSRRPVLAMVDMIPGGAFNQHWVTIVGKRGNDYIITDPWTADLVPLTRYENKIYRLAGYSRD